MLTWNATVTAVAAAVNSIAVSQTTGGAHTLTLVSTPVVFGSAQRPTLTSTGNISGVNFTFTGTGPDGQPLVQTIAGPNNNTVTALVGMKSVSQVFADGAIATGTSAGNSATADSPMFVADADSNPFSVGFGCSIPTGSTPTFTVQHTFDDVLKWGHHPADFYNYGSPTNTWFDHSVIVDKTTDQDGNYTFPVRAIRFIVTVAGTVTMKLNQSGGGWR